jgi:3-deoxy-D-manno-octulosonate 8-phosphate phosphatase (KDO 8-P phosphatase)
MIELIIIDVDGTLTDGKVYYDNDGQELKSFNIKDGLMISSWNKLGKKSAIITGRTSHIVEKRAAELGIQFVRQGIKNKLECLDKLLKELNLDYSNVAVIGDDMNDYNILQKAQISFSPNDANYRIQDLVDVVINKKGGEGCVANMIEKLIEKEKLEEEFIDLWV